MLDSIYHDIKLLTKSIFFVCENVKILPSFTQCYNGRHYAMLLNLYRFYCYPNFYNLFTGRTLHKQSHSGSVYGG